MKNKLVILCLSIFAVFNTQFSVFADAPTAKSAEQFAKLHFKEIVLEHIRSEDSTYYNLSKSEEISFGKLYKVHTLSKEFISSKKQLTGNLGIEDGNLYISAVYQDGNPVNVISTFKNDNGEFMFATFGFGAELAKALDEKSTNGGKIIYEEPADSWYIFENGRVSGFSKPTDNMLGGESLTLKEFREYVYDKYGNLTGITEKGEQTKVGTSFQKAYEKKAPEIVLQSGFIISLISIIIGLVYFKRKKSKISV